MHLFLALLRWGVPYVGNCPFFPLELYSLYNRAELKKTWKMSVLVLWGAATILFFVASLRRREKVVFLRHPLSFSAAYYVLLTILLYEYIYIYLILLASTPCRRELREAKVNLIFVFVRRVIFLR